jgi:hypothetical protein
MRIAGFAPGTGQFAGKIDIPDRFRGALTSQPLD